MSTPPDDPFPDPVRVPVEDSFDLHSFSPRDIPSVVKSAAGDIRRACLAWPVMSIFSKWMGFWRMTVGCFQYVDPDQVVALVVLEQDGKFLENAFG